MDDTIINNLIKDPINTIKTISVDEAVSILEKADEYFFNTNETLFSDDIYDILKKYLKKIAPKNDYFKKIGADITINKEELPFYMGSLDKIKEDEKGIGNWVSKYNKSNYVISEKLDGISGLLYCDGKTTKLFTRGNGVYGQNITHLIPYLNIPQLTNKIGIRGELIISKNNWQKISHVGANARNVVAGVLHSKTVNTDIIKYIEFIAYDVLYPRNKLSLSFKLLHDTYPLIKIVKNTIVDKITLDVLSGILEDYRKKSNYEIDGIVIYDNEEHKIVKNKNPTYAFAFKTILTQEQAEVIVTDVEWNVSKHGFIKPIVKFNEVSIGGVKIKQATGFNGSYIYNNKIGAGSHIIIIRSGDVIPHIVSVLSVSSSGQPKMPDIPYKWNDTNVDIIIQAEQNKEQDIQSFIHFMKTLDIDGVKEGVITKLYNNGHDTIKKIINITKEEVLKIEGFKETSSQKLLTALSNIKNGTVSCNKLLVASNVFGRGIGEKKLKLITDEYPFIATNREKALKLNIDDITKIQGMATISATQFLEGLPKYYAFYDELGIKCVSSVTKAVANTTNNKLEIFKDKKIVFTGFRNKDYEKLIEENGGKIVTTVSKNTNILVVKDIDESGTKIEKARELGVKIITKEELEELLQ